MARRQLAHNANLTLGTTSLLHEAYMDMAGRDGVVFPDRARFMAYAGRVMRALIIDYARGRKAQKRGGGFQLVPLVGEVEERVAAPDQLSRISDALDELARLEPALAHIVDLKYFCGFSFVEIAALQGTSERTVQRQWEKARIYLHGVLRDGEPLR